jgi:hypothetical protein
MVGKGEWKSYKQILDFIPKQLFHSWLFCKNYMCYVGVSEIAAKKAITSVFPPAAYCITIRLFIIFHYYYSSTIYQ